jgi:hypothetical protein
MKCLSFGYLIVYIIVIMIISALLPIPGAMAIGSVAEIGLIIWFIAGFFIKCEPAQ